MDFFIQKGLENSPAQFSPGFKRLLLPVKQWVLAELIDDLKTEFQKKGTVEDFEQFLDIAKRYITDFNSKSEAGFNSTNEYELSWVRCIIFLSLQSLSRKLDKPVIWTKLFSDQKAVEADEMVITEFSKLYDQWETYVDKEKEFAQPYAYYLLFTVAITHQLFKAKIALRNENDKLRNYLHCIETGQSHITDRLIEFAKDYYRNGNKLIANVEADLELNTTTHFEHLNLKNVNIAPLFEPDGCIRILAVGIPGSGKSTIIKMVRHVLAAPVNDKINMPLIPLPISRLEIVRDETMGVGEGNNYFGSLSNRAKPTAIALSEVTGDIQINGNQYTMSFFDTRGGILMEPPPKYVASAEVKEKDVLELSLTKTDLLLIILDPETIFFQNKEGFSFQDVLGFITSRLDYLFHHSKHAMVSLVFAKFDEYGSVIRGPRNLIHNERQISCLLRFMETGTDQAWDDLILEISNSYSDNGEKTSLQRTIIVLLERLKHLIKIILNSKKHPVINFYIASSAVMKDVKSSLWTGYPEVFNDFADYMGWLIKKKEELKIPHPLNIQATLSNHDIVIEWFNATSRDLLSIVERKTGTDDFKAINQASLTLQECKGRYNDTMAEFNQSYSYRVKFIDSITDQNASPYSEIVTVIVPPKPLVQLFPPVDLSSSLVSESVLLEWNNMNAVAVLNQLERKEQGGDYKLIFDQQQAENNKSYTDHNVQPGKIYYYRLRSAEKDTPANLSTYSDEIQVRTVPNKIRQLKCELKPDKDSPEYTDLSWDESQNVFSVSYRITREVTNSHGDVLPVEYVVETDDNFYKDKTIIRGNTYQYIVVAVEKLQNRLSVPTRSEAVKIERTNTLAWVILIILIIIVLILIVIAFYPAVN